MLDNPTSVYLNSESEGEKKFQIARKMALDEVSPSLVADSPYIYADRRDVALSLTRIHLFEKILSVQGSVVECGVHRGNSLMLYYHLSSIFEPSAVNRKIIGFDTFEGFPGTSQKDPEGIPDGHLADTSLSHLEQWIRLQDNNRPIGHVPKVELVKGDARETIPEYVNANPHLIIALLYLDFDLYEPTLVALKNLLPLVPKGGVVGFDQVNQRKWAGETLAFKESLEISNVNLRKFSYDAHVSYFTVA